MGSLGGLATWSISRASEDDDWQEPEFDDDDRGKGLIKAVSYYRGPETTWPKGLGMITYCEVTGGFPTPPRTGLIRPLSGSCPTFGTRTWHFVSFVGFLYHSLGAFRSKL